MRQNPRGKSEKTQNHSTVRIRSNHNYYNHFVHRMCVYFLAKPMVSGTERLGKVATHPNTN